MIKCKPERDPKKAVFLVTSFAVLCLAVALCISLVPSYKGIFQIAFIVILAVGLNMVIRFTMSEMEYTLTEDSFEVRKKVGNKVTVLCSLSLEATIALVDKKTYKDNSALYGNINMRYNFNQNVCANSAFFICEFNKKRLLVEFEPNKAFYDCFLEKIDENKK